MSNHFFGFYVYIGSIAVLGDVVVRVTDILQKSLFGTSPDPVVVPRTILLMMLVVCLNGCFSLEHPDKTFFTYYPRFREFVAMLETIGGSGTVA